MNKRLFASAAAVLMAFSMLAGCSDSSQENAGEETAINIIDNGTAASGDNAPEVSDSGAQNGEGTSFVDPADLLGVTDTGAEQSEPAQTDATTAPPTYEEILSMIESNNSSQGTPVMTEYNIDHKSRYGYNQLNAEEKALYDAIYDAAVNLKTRVAVDDSVTDEMWVKVYGMVYLQEPQLFWLTSQKMSRGKVWYWETDKSVIDSMQKEIDAAAAELVKKVDGKSDFEKLEFFHDYICVNSSFDGDESYNQTVYGGLIKHKLQCEGYAKTMQYLCDMANIESMIVVGTTSEGVSHGWNVVKVDGEWYNLDATWGDPVLTVEDPTNVRHRFFLVPDAWMHNKSHFNINKKTTGTQVTYFTPPACTSEKANYFAQKGLLFSDKASADEAIKQAMKTAAANNKRAAEIRVTSKELYDQMIADLSTYASWIKNENSAVKAVSNNCDENTLVIQLDLLYQ